MSTLRDLTKMNTLVEGKDYTKKLIEIFIKNPLENPVNVLLCLIAHHSLKATAFFKLSFIKLCKLPNCL